MRFFKSFKLIHRRTRSEPQISVVPGLANLQEAAASTSCNNLPSAKFLTVAPDVLPVPHPNVRLLDLMFETTDLRNTLAATVDDVNRLKAQLTATQADLFAELHRSARQRQKDQEEICKLQETLAEYEEVFITAGSHQAFSTCDKFDHILDQALHRVAERVKACLVPNSKYIESPTFGPRTRDDYMSAIQITLKSRLQLKQCKRIAKFWKKTAQADGRNITIVTPSASTISSVLEDLPVERQKAVGDLIARRRASVVSPLPDLPKTPSQMETLVQESTFKAAVLLSPSRSLPQSRPCLSPLASQSLRQELGKFASTNRLANWPHPSRKPLEQLDFNVRSYNVEGSGYSSNVSEAACRIQPPIHSTRDRDRMSKRRVLPLVSDPLAPILTPYQDPGVMPVAVINGPNQLGKICEEYRQSDSSFSSNDSQLGWVECQSDDVSSMLVAGSLAPVAKSRVPKGSLRKPKSKIPLPVFKTLKRLSQTRPGMSEVKDMMGSSFGKKVLTKPSPTRLPVWSR